MAGGEPIWTQSGQSNRWAERSSEPPSDVTTSFTTPAAEQTTSSACGLISGDATATPMDSANQASTSRTRKRACRRVRIEADYLAPAAPRVGVFTSESSRQVGRGSCGAIVSGNSFAGRALQALGPGLRQTSAKRRRAPKPPRLQPESVRPVRCRDSRNRKLQPAVRLGRAQ